MTKAAGKLLGESAKQAEQVTKGKEEAIQQVKDQVEKAAEVIQKSRYTDAEKKAMIKKAEELEAQAADNIVKLGRAQFLQAVKHPPTVVLPIQDTIKLIPIKK
jgi:acetolactate synthase small subunit